MKLLAVLALGVALIATPVASHVSPRNCEPYENIVAQLQEAKWGEVKTQVIGIMNPGTGILELWTSTNVSETRRGAVENSWSLVVVNPNIGVGCMVATGYFAGKTEEEIIDKDFIKSCVVSLSLITISTKVDTSSFKNSPPFNAGKPSRLLLF